MANSDKSAPAAKGLKAAIVPVTPFQQNCTLLWDPETMVGAVVDPGGDLDRIEGAIAEIGLKPEKILLTHGHIDHAGGAAELRERLGGIPIEGPHAAEQPLLDNLETQAASYGIPARTVTPDRWLADGETVEVAGHTFEVLHCPGHSPGSVVLLNRAQSFAMMGDVLFQGSVGRTDLPLGSHETLMNSIRTKLLPLPDEIAFICGHGPTSTIGHERRTNPFIAGL
ncbi:putative metal-binding YcbL-like protein [Hyphomicrobium sulfonivorans]|uniref:Putative metal-binding YcbL-like protein n=1 Tax=Hyphomicrobium sulfonivorans TaxID=121290 RepID=A0A120CT88_HYPSL|nr:MBL fold metallo-hydrolase [Hyphomicrobium sulfonivorans]KWT64257.1 putative metal-binding YcbL-like protein [Hyphomicrobium sulfonivorans]